MKLHEVLSSGKEFRIKGSDGAYMPASDDALGWTFTTTEILEFDWELKLDAREWDCWVAPHTGSLCAEDMSAHGWKQVRVREVMSAY